MSYISNNFELLKPHFVQKYNIEPPKGTWAKLTEQQIVGFLNYLDDSFDAFETIDSPDKIEAILDDILIKISFKSSEIFLRNLSISNRISYKFDSFLENIFSRLNIIKIRK